ncbi:MAG: insulinase family protein [Candidatus Eremiobacteraeota bacterium]|nr:insulinase family protein [Candidatus Eremiobacteraeota bacterium]MBV8365818.1 insulinase family protein [Candidatus Eremiobacteraeota bacterium]
MSAEPHYAKTTLPNGIRVITEHMPLVRSASIGLWVGVGSSHEAAELRGISHCIEHMLFKGTRSRSARDIAELMDSIGGNLNAFTDKETTCYHARVVDDTIETTLDLLGDMFLNSVFEPAELRKEQGVILEEIRMYDDSPEEVAHDLFLRSVWAGSPLGDPTIGYEQTVSAVTSQAIGTYMGERYTPDSIVLTAAGNVDHESIVQQTHALLGDMRGEKAGGDPPQPTFVPANVIRRKDCEQAYVLFGVEGASARDDRRYQLTLLDTILGGGMASRMFHEIREKRGLAYSVYSSHTPYRNAGLMTVAASTSPKHAREVVSLVRQELARMAADGVSDEELKRAKQHVKGGLLLSLESTSTRMLRLGRSELNVGRHVPAEEIVERIDAATKAQVDQLAASLFAPERIALTVLGPVDERLGHTSQALEASA